MQRNDAFLADIIGFLKTKEEAGKFTNELVLLHNSLYNIGRNDFTHTEKAKIRSKTVTFLEDLMVKQNIDKTNAQSISNFITQIQQSIQNCSIFEITISFEPTQETNEIISSWLDANFNEPILIDLKTDNTLIAGCVITFRGKYKDYSLCDKLLETINKSILLLNKS